MRCLKHMKITRILRLKEMNLFAYRDVAKSVGCSKTTVGDVLARCKECGLNYEAASSMTQDEINRLVYPESFGPKQVKEEPDWESPLRCSACVCKKELLKYSGKGMWGVSIIFIMRYSII